MLDMQHYHEKITLGMLKSDAYWRYSDLWHRWCFRAFWKTYNYSEQRQGQHAFLNTHFEGTFQNTTGAKHRFS